MLPLTTLGVADVAMNRTGVVLLGWVGQTTDAGIYALAFNIAFLTALPRTAVNALLAPAIADLFARGDRAALQALAPRSALWTLLGAACIALPAAVLAEPVLSWFGRDFAAGVPALRILLAGQVIVAGAGHCMRHRVDGRVKHGHDVTRRGSGEPDSRGSSQAMT